MEIQIYHDFTHCNHYIPNKIINLKKLQAIYISDFKEKMTQIWPKRDIFEFFHKMIKHNFFRLQRLGLVQKIENSNERIAKKCEKLPFLGILGQNGQFWTVFGQNGQNGNFLQKALGKFFSCLKALINCKVSEK